MKQYYLCQKKFTSTKFRKQRCIKKFFKTTTYAFKLCHTYSDPHINEYDNVTILYADIVNYTQMTSTLKSLKLVETLHELFGRFDDASREQFDIKQLTPLFGNYTHKVNHGYMSTFLILLCALMLTHFLLVLSLNAQMDSLHKVMLDLILYGTLSILPVFGLLVSEKYVKNHPKLLLVLSAMAFVLLFLANILVPIVHYVHDDEYLRPIYTTLLIISCYVFLHVTSNIIDDEYLRPIYTTLLIISCYVFLHVTSNIIAVCLGFIVTIAHLLILNFITYSDNTEFNWGRLGSDLLYLICLNGFGIYFRLITELIKMRSFLDKRTCVESTTKLRAEKEQREKLMLSIIPKHIMDEVFTQIYEVVRNDQITYPIKILACGNRNCSCDLFGKLVWDLKVQRIKFLGDCYYCVAGLPDDGYIGEQKDHADACVQLGLEMIAIIADVKNEFRLDINMRIGVHTGRIIGGIIGITKWQFDIWSKDVYIANRMETAGQAGKVHITGQTKAQLKKQYNIELSDAGTRDPELQKHRIDCYLISPEPQTHHYTNGTAHGVPEELPLSVSRLPDPHCSNGVVTDGRRPSQYIRRGSLATNRSSAKTGAVSYAGRRRFTPNTLSRRTPFMDNNLSRRTKTVYTQHVES
ncbi:Adenylyl cyclase N-terminal extracellular and transmembrane region [Popillia japonica]|uniref:adenylate cyclase n=1 Tax=Popillia japonica TaxID=7064 RepID=A0AAW1IUF7_POPJA